MTVTLTDARPEATVAGDAEAGVAGGGAFTSITRTPHWLTALTYSWKVQKVMLSVGSIETCE